MSGRQRILVCDDEPQILRTLRVILDEAGFAVLTAASAQEALDAAAEGSPDAAIVDLLLPDGDGVGVTRSIREWSEIPILVLSAVEEEVEKIRALDAGADDYVTKPFGPANWWRGSTPCYGGRPVTATSLPSWSTGCSLTSRRTPSP